MGTLRDELAKLPSLDSMRFDDDPAPATTPQAVSAPAISTSANRRIWEYLRDNPASNTSEIADALGMDAIATSRALYNLRRRGIVAHSATSVAGNARYISNVDEYPTYDAGPSLEKAWAARRQAARAARAAKASTKHMKPPPPPVAAIPARTDLDLFIDSLSIVQARDLYDRLKKIFTA